MDGWARFGAALAGGGRDEAYQRGFTNAAQRDALMTKERKARVEAMARQALAEKAFEEGNNELGNAVLAGMDPRQLSGYRQDQQGIGWGDEAWKVATAPDRDIELLNAMNLVRDGKPRPLTQIQGGMVVNPMLAPQSQEVVPSELAQAMIGTQNAHAGAYGAQANASNALAEKRRRIEQAAPADFGNVVAGLETILDKPLETPELPGARRAPDGNLYVPDPSRKGKWLRVDG